MREEGQVAGMDKIRNAYTILDFLEFKPQMEGNNKIPAKETELEKLIKIKTNLMHTHY
jgi:hypothetical protein